MNPDGTPINPAPQATPPAPVVDEPPAWAAELIASQQQFGERISSMEDKFTAPVADEPVAPDPAEWTPKSWEEVANKIEETAQEKAQRLFQDREDEARAAQDTTAAEEKRINDYLDTQVAEIEKANGLPAIVNDNDPNDPGKIARKELFGYAYSMGSVDLKAAHQTLQMAHAAGKMYDFTKNEWVASQSQPSTFPVASSNSGTGSASVKVPEKDFKNLTLDQLAARYI